MNVCIFAFAIYQNNALLYLLRLNNGHDVGVAKQKMDSRALINYLTTMFFFSW